MKYKEVAEAKSLPGLRLALTIGVPGPWGESAKKVFEYKGIDYVPVAQYPGQPNEDLVAWTGIRNAPIALYNDEPPRSNFQDIVALAERLKPEPSLLPSDPIERWQCMGISADICGDGGFGWKRRHLMAQRPKPDPQDTATKPMRRPNLDANIMQNAYGGTDTEHAISARYVAQMLDAFAHRLEAQKNAGSDYFVGQTISACDIHWACFSALLEPMPDNVNPMPDWLRHAYGYLGEEVESHKHPILLEHRDMVFTRHLSLPLDF